MNTTPVRWGVLSTANIAAGNFLPSLRASGSGVAAVVGSRSLEAAQRFARTNGVERAVEGYDAVVNDDGVDAIYVPLPNSLHAEWTIAALRAGKPVLCEKPLCLTVEETEQVLQVARETGTLLWEAFVFPFDRQSARLKELLSSGAIGEPAEVQASFHFQLRRPEDIRFDPALGGGALYDVGCYCIRFANLVFEVTPDRAASMVTWSDRHVDVISQGVLEYPDRGRLLFSCSFELPYLAGSSVIGPEGIIRVSHPYHPPADATLTLIQGNDTHIEHTGTEEPTFTEALRSINAAMRGEGPAEHLAIDEALPVATGMQLVREAWA